MIGAGLFLALDGTGCAAHRDCVRVADSASPGEVQCDQDFPDPDNRYDLRRWIGHSVHELVRTWGTATTKLPNGATTTWIWRWVKPDKFSYNSMGTGAWIAHEVAWSDQCKDSFDVDESGRIVGVHADGKCPPRPTDVVDRPPAPGSSPSGGYGVGEQ